MQKLLTTNFSEEVLNLKPKLPECACDYYITDSSSRRSFFEWIHFYEDAVARPEENEWLNETDKLRYDFLHLPAQVRQAGHKRLFGNSWKYYATRQSLYLAGLAFFKPESALLTVIYREAELRKSRQNQQELKQKQFLYNIEKGQFT